LLLNISPIQQTNA